MKVKSIFVVMVILSALLFCCGCQSAGTLFQNLTTTPQAKKRIASEQQIRDANVVNRVVDILLNTLVEERENVLVSLNKLFDEDIVALAQQMAEIRKPLTPRELAQIGTNLRLSTTIDIDAQGRPTEARYAAQGQISNASSSPSLSDWQPQTPQSFGFITSDDHSTIKPDAYGMGVHINRFGQPVILKPDFGGVYGERLEIKTDGYGMGVHMDQYGRPVREKKWP